MNVIKHGGPSIGIYHYLRLACAFARRVKSEPSFISYFFLNCVDV